ncbi:heme exporter protein CcmD [Erwinia pyrifoliae]|uniref:Heme exporter protein D n=1 Tax=Erwinia pyrifoliae TaxID=79967 RepID=A0ABY5XAY8_ERWPY|nr:heme exporter protein CcmD [Erwinia pyrifoliae]AUX73271.1 heme exporter protein CcmD [Erwinia pyrifoliae]MCA8876441.1 heme exporter protein CcmD [Erwinia pyrifoliae]MCT2386558.1 heme exporter protein CcmD [Erwinia pyrifoliae]MCU8587845.1 heme exporter protein CcmD [Erwinia pyrifoliae]UWS31638.1 heme exporter protein CcmD [Erwinia pyrifoliae]
MTPAFSSWQDFFAMGGYALYVWLAVAFTLIPLAALVVHTCWQRRRLLDDIRQRRAREQRIQAAKVKKATQAVSGEQA